MIGRPMMIQIAQAHGDIIGCLIDHVGNGRYLAIVLVIQQVLIKMILLLY